MSIYVDIDPGKVNSLQNLLKEHGAQGDLATCPICVENLHSRSTIEIVNDYLPTSIQIPTWTKASIPHNIALLTDCKHVFHKICIRQWIEQQKNTCPSCRNAIQSGDIENIKSSTSLEKAVASAARVPKDIIHFASEFQTSIKTFFIAVVLLGCWSYNTYHKQLLNSCTRTTLEEANFNESRKLLVQQINECFRNNFQVLDIISNTAQLTFITSFYLTISSLFAVGFVLISHDITTFCYTIVAPLLMFFFSFTSS